MRKWTVVACVALVGALVAGFVVWRSDDGDAQERDLLITAEVERRTLRDAITLRGVVDRAEQRTVNSATDGRISSDPVEDGTTVQAGDTILGIEGRAAVAVQGELPFFRSLDVGAAGPDVLQLEEILSGAGYDPGRIDGVYDEATRSALAGWQAAHGYPRSAPETEENVTVSLTQGTGYTVGPRSSVAVVIGQNTAPIAPAAGTPAAAPALVGPVAPMTLRLAAAQATPVAAFATSPSTASEGDHVSVRVQLDRAAPGNLTLQIAFSGTAGPGQDFVATSPVVVPSGASFVDVDLELTDDSTVEPAETIVLTVLPGSGYAVGSPATTQVTIAASSGDPVLTVRADAATAAEGTPATFTILASEEPGSDLEVPFAFAGTAQEGVDFLAPAGTVTLPASQTQVSVPVTIRQDSLVEPDETVTLVLLPGPDHQVGQPSSATTTILSDDVPELTLQGGGTVSEGSLRRLTVRADTASPRDVAVALTAGGTATPGTDFTPLPATVTLPAGATSVSVDVQSLADSVVERDETVVVSIGAPAGDAYRLGTVSTQTVTIREGGDSSNPVLTIRPDARVVAEGAPATFVVSSDRAIDRELEVSLALGGTATPGADVDPPAGRVVVAPGERAVQVSVNVRRDDLVEGDETLEVTITGSPDYRVGLQSTASVIVESADLPELSVVGGGSVSEGSTGSVTIVADQAPVEDTSVQYQVVGTATAGVDLLPTPGTAILRAGQTSVTVPIRTIDDDVVFQPTDMIAGTWPARIGTVLVSQGDAVAPGSPLFTITEPDLTITLTANPSDRSRVVVGQEVDVTIEASDQEARGVITELDDVATVDLAAGTESYEGIVEIPDELAAADGASVTLEVILEERIDALVVPIAAVGQGPDGRDEVRVIDLATGELRRVQVETGLQDGAFIEVRSGLEGGEIVVVEVDAA